MRTHALQRKRLPNPSTRRRLRSRSPSSRFRFQGVGSWGGDCSIHMCFGGSGEGKSEETVRAQIAEGGQIDRAFVELCTIALVVLMCVEVRMRIHSVR